MGPLAGWPLSRSPFHAGANALPQRVVEDAFRDHYGKTVNFHRFSDAVSKLQRWYEERGYFGQIVDMEMQGNVAEVSRGEEWRERKGRGGEGRGADVSAGIGSACQS